MKYVKPSLHLLNLDEFDYPPLHVHVGIETYGGLDREERVTVYFDKKFAGRYTMHHVFSEQTFLVDVAEIRAEVKEFNSDITGNWNKIILGLLHKQELDLADQLASRIESLKSVRKQIEQFSGKG